MVSVEVINKFLSYDAETGIFRWKVDIGKKVKKGNVAGSKKNDGYIRIKIHGKDYAAHRLAYLLVHGELPQFLDHIDRNRANNRISNLRACTLSENQFNKGVTKRSTSGIKGVAWNDKSKKWRAQSKLNGKSYYLGSFESKEEAINAYQSFCKKNHGDFYSPMEAK